MTANLTGPLTSRAPSATPGTDTGDAGPAPANVSVVICTYNAERFDLLRTAVASVEAQNPPAVEIVVVVDHNDSVLGRASGEFAGARVVPSTGSRGLSGARNTGIAEACGDLVAFLDDDAAAEPGWLACLLEAFSNPSVAVVGGSAIPAWSAGRPGWFPEEFDWVVGCSYRGLPGAASEVRNVIGANMAFRREVFTAIGGFQEGVGRIGTLPLGCEETEICIRLRQGRPGAIVLFQPEAKVAHFVPTERGTWSYFLSRCYAEGQSKATVARLVGRADALTSERRYTWRVLPRGVVRGLGDAVRGDLAGAGRAAGVVLGLGWTTAGYARGLAKNRTASRNRTRP